MAVPFSPGSRKKARRGQIPGGLPVQGMVGVLLDPRKRLGGLDGEYGGKGNQKERGQRREGAEGPLWRLQCPRAQGNIIGERR